MGPQTAPVTDTGRRFGSAYMPGSSPMLGWPGGPASQSPAGMGGEKSMCRTWSWTAELIAPSSALHSLCNSGPLLNPLLYSAAKWEEKSLYMFPIAAATNCHRLTACNDTNYLMVWGLEGHSCWGFWGALGATLLPKPAAGHLPVSLVLLSPSRKDT